MTKSSPAGPQACMTCAKAKAKCLLQPSSGACERCRRLRKPCFPQTPAPPRKRARKHKQTMKKPSRVKALEGRIEELSSRLATVAGHHMPVESASHDRSESVASPDVNVETHTELISSHGAWTESEEPSIPLFESPNPASQGSSEPPFLISAKTLRQTQQSVMTAQTRKMDKVINPTSMSRHDEEITTRISLYRTHMQPQFPFVIIPPELANQEDRTRRPFLWRAVKMATLWQENTRHIKLGKRLLNDLTDAILLKPYKSFDVVQGLLVFIAWYHRNLDKFQLTNLLGLLQSLCLSLNFDQNTLTRIFGKDQAQNVRDDILDQGRAYCGFYYLSTIVFTMSEKPEACPQTHFIDQLCDILLSQDLQPPTDKWLVALVKVQRLAQSIEMMKSSRKLGGHSGVSLNTIVLGFEQQISNLKRSFSEDVAADQFLQHHLLIMDMILYEVAVSDPAIHLILDQGSTMSHGVAGTSGNFLDTFEMQQQSTKARIDLLNACLASVKAFLENHSSHNDDFIELNFMASFDMAYCLKLCRRLTELRGVPGWETNTIKYRLGLNNELLEKRVADVKKLAVEKNTFETSQISRYDCEEDEDAVLQPMRPEINDNMTKHPFQSTADDLNTLLALFSGETGEGTETFAGSDVATSKARHEHQDTAEKGKGHTIPHSNAMGGIGGQETRTAESKELVEAFWQMAAPISLSARERAGAGQESATALSKNGLSSTMAANAAEMPYSFPAGGFSQISFWPRLLRNEDET